MNQYGDILNIDSQTPRNVNTQVVSSNFESVEDMKNAIKPMNGVVLDINK